MVMFLYANLKMVPASIVTAELLSETFIFHQPLFSSMYYLIGLCLGKQAHNIYLHMTIM
jgi:hypothetical protein